MCVGRWELGRRDSEKTYVNALRGPIQTHEKYDITGGIDLSTSAKVLRGARLSGRMYKICTLLSTDNVDNGLPGSTCTGRKALLHAASGGVATRALA